MEWKGAHLRYGQTERWDGTSWEPSASCCNQATHVQAHCITMVSSVMPGFLLLLSLPALLSTPSTAHCLPHAGLDFRVGQFRSLAAEQPQLHYGMSAQTLGWEQTGVPTTDEVLGVHTYFLPSSLPPPPNWAMIISCLLPG